MANNFVLTGSACCDEIAGEHTIVLDCGPRRIVIELADGAIVLKRVQRPGVEKRTLDETGSIDADLAWLMGAA